MKTINLRRVLSLTALSVLTLSATAQQITTKHPIVDLGRVTYRQPVTADFQLRNSSRSEITINEVRTNCGGGDYSDWTAPVNFTTDIACPVPTALQANNISAYVAELNWTSDASQWDIAYRANGSDEFTEITGVTQKPYTLQDLNPESCFD